MVIRKYQIITRFVLLLDLANLESEQHAMDMAGKIKEITSLSLIWVLFTKPLSIKLIELA